MTVHLTYNRLFFEWNTEKCGDRGNIHEESNFMVPFVLVTLVRVESYLESSITSPTTTNHCLKNDKKEKKIAEKKNQRSFHKRKKWPNFFYLHGKFYCLCKNWMEESNYTELIWKINCSCAYEKKNRFFNGLHFFLYSVTHRFQKTFNTILFHDPWISSYEFFNWAIKPQCLNLKNRISESMRSREKSSRTISAENATRCEGKIIFIRKCKFLYIFALMKKNCSFAFR